jgi:DNA topoisomerase-1
MNARPNASRTRRRSPRSAPDPFSQPAETAREAMLRYVRDDEPGIRRRRRGHGFHYIAFDNRPVRNPQVLKRIRALAIPPAWRDVWICASGEGHLQATGRDDRGRKQYRYHARWRRVRDETKYERMLKFGRALPVIRERVRRDLALPGLPRAKLLAAVVRLLESTFMRVGNAEYERANGSHGLTTLHNSHAHVSGTKVRLRFRGKSGKTHAIDLTDKRLARVVKRSRSLPGQHLFQYLDEEDEPHRVTSSDVNDYLREIAREEFTAKDFRTWAGTLLAARGLSRADGRGSRTHAKKLQVGTVRDVASALGNTPAICRKCYIHPAVLRAFEDPEARAAWERASRRSAAR